MPVIFPTLAAMSGVIGTAALLGAGGTAAGMAMAGAAKEATQQANEASDIAQGQAGALAAEQEAIIAQTKAAAEAPAKATDAAKSALEKRKRIQRLSGGQTLLTSEGYPSTLGAKTLLGA